MLKITVEVRIFRALLQRLSLCTLNTGGSSLCTVQSSVKRMHSILRIAGVLNGGPPVISVQRGSRWSSTWKITAVTVCSDDNYSDWQEP